jgi:hypothetical protein
MHQMAPFRVHIVECCTVSLATGWRQVTVLYYHVCFSGSDIHFIASLTMKNTMFCMSYCRAVSTCRRHLLWQQLDLTYKDAAATGFSLFVLMQYAAARQQVVCYGCDGMQSAAVTTITVMV